MADPVRNYIRRSRPELASYRSRKSFWEKVSDSNEGSTAKKKPVSVPTFGDIRKKFNETNQRRSGSLPKGNDAEKSVPAQTKTAADALLLTSARQKSVSPSNDEFSRKPSRRRSLEKPKETFLHMTEVMEGYVPSDSDSVASSKDKTSPKTLRNTASISNITKAEETFSTLPSSRTEAAATEIPSGKQSPPTSNDGSFRKRNRVRRRGSGKEARFDAVKKEDIESARLRPVSDATKQDVTLEMPKVFNLPKNETAKDIESNTTGQEEGGSQGSVNKLQRQDSGDNPLKRKRDRKLQKLKLTNSSTETKDANINSSITSPKTPSYEAKSVLSGIQLSSPKSPHGKSLTHSKLIHSKQDHVLDAHRNPESSKILPALTTPRSPKKQYESLFMGRKLNLTKSEVDGPTHVSAKMLNQVAEGNVSNQMLQPLSIDIEDTLKASDGVDSSSETPKAYDPVDLNCSEHRWSTIDSGISVACALQQNSDANKTTKATVQPALVSSDVTARNSRQRRYRRQSTSSSDSDDDSGISWDELRDFRDVPLVVVDKVPDDHANAADILSCKEEASNVKIELDNSLDKETEMLTDGLVKQKSKLPSAIGSRINQKFKQEDGSDVDLDRDLPLRTSTPTGSRVSVILEPSKLFKDSSSDKSNKKDFSLAGLKKISADSIKSAKTGDSLQTPTSKHDNQARPSRFTKFFASEPDNIKTSTISQSNEDIFGKDEIKETRTFNNTENEEKTQKTQSKLIRQSSDDLEYKSQQSPSSAPRAESLYTSSKDKARSKSDGSEPNYFQVRSRSLTRQQSPLDPMEDVLTKRSPFRVPSSLSSQNDPGIQRRIPGVLQYQRTHTHSRTNYNGQPVGLYRAKSNPILYEPPVRTSRRDEQQVEKYIKPVIRPRDSSLPRIKVNTPPVFTPSPPQPTSLASRLLPQRRRSLHRSIDVESESSMYTPYTTDDDEGHSDSGDKQVKSNTVNRTNGHASGQKSSKPRSSLGTMPCPAVFSDSDCEEQAPKRLMAPSLRLRQKVRSRTSSSSLRPMDLSFSDTECVDGTVVVRKRRRSRTRSRGDDQASEIDINAPESNVNVQVTSTEAGDRKIDTLDSQHSSQARRQISLSKTHRTSSKLVDRETDLDDSLNEEQLKGNSTELKHMKDRNNNMISKQNRSGLSLEQLAEEEIISSASKLQIDLYKHKKHFEKDLSNKLETAMEQSDNLVSALRKSMNEPRAKDKVQQAMKNVNEVIKFDIIRDYRAKLQWYKVEINLGSYTQNVDARKTSNYRVTVSCEMPSGPKFSKDIHLDFPESVDLSQLEILQVGDDLELRVPFATWNPPPTMDDVIQTGGGDPKDTFTRIGFLEKAYRSMGLQWPPEGGAAHYEYFSTRGSNSYDFTKRPKKPPAYQSLLQSGQLKACQV